MEELKPQRRLAEKIRRRERAAALSEGYTAGTLSETDRFLVVQRRQVLRDRKSAMKTVKEGGMENDWKGGVVIDLGFDGLMRDQVSSRCNRIPWVAPDCGVKLTVIVGDHIHDLATILCLLVQSYRHSTFLDDLAHLVLPECFTEIVGEDEQVELGEMDEVLLVGRRHGGSVSSHEPGGKWLNEWINFSRTGKLGSGCDWGYERRWDGLPDIPPGWTESSIGGQRQPQARLSVRRLAC